MANPSRRSVLRTGVVLAAACAPLAATGQAFSSVVGGMASGLRRSTFQPHVGSTFRFVDRSRTYKAKLTKVADVTAAAKGHEQRFRLQFTMHGAGPGQGTYTLRHSALKAMPLFVAPIGNKPGVYEAIINS